MGKINVVRVILGGLLAGLVINVGEYVLNTYVIAEQSSAIMERLGLPAVGGGQIAGFLVLGFVLGLVMIFVYAGIRPRFGAGVKTAIIAGVSVWVVGLVSGIADLIIGLVPGSLLAVAAIWGLVEMAVAAVAGAWVYQESA